MGEPYAELRRQPSGPDICWPPGETVPMLDECEDLWPEKYHGVAVEMVKYTARSKHLQGSHAI